VRILPSKQVFSKLKTLLRKAAERTVTATWQRIGQLLDAFTPPECANYLRNSGYADALAAPSGLAHASALRTA